MLRATLAALLLLAACGRDDAGAPAGSTPAQPAAEAPAGPHRVAVCATASLRRAFEALAARYEAAHSGAEVGLHFDGGTQILNALDAGEKCDVVALGENSVMARVVAAGHTAVGSPTELARSRIAIAVARGNPKRVEGLADFARDDLRVALGTRTASIRRHANWVLSRLSLRAKPAVETTTADGVLAKIAAGEADVGIVYATSFVALPDDAGVEAIPIPEEQNTPVLYSISVAREPAEPRGASAFYALALGEEGQAVMKEMGFRGIGEK